MNEFDNEEQSMRTMRGNTNEGTIGRIDQYDIIRKLGGGGFGVVYLVRDTQSDIEYAIKTLHPLLKSNPEEMENLRSQFKLVSKLSYPYIASAMYLHPVKEVEYYSDELRKDIRLTSGDFVMVMKYAPGVTLSQWRKQFPNGIVPVDYAIGICSHVAAALDYAHSEKIIHRDVKPSNVMVETREDGTTIARVLDFGLAAEIRSSMSRVSTEKGDTSGTRPYMAPEQWQGKKQGAATDQYALACMFYELVSGAVPFAGAFETGDAFIMKDVVLNNAPERLSVLTEAQNDALQNALLKSMDDRYQSCSEFVEALVHNDKISEEINPSYNEYENASVVPENIFSHESIRSNKPIRKIGWLISVIAISVVVVLIIRLVFVDNFVNHSEPIDFQEETYYKTGEEFYNQGNYTEAVKWYRKAAEQGDAAAQCGLGFSYAIGQGVSQNFTEAVKWFRKSAEQGNADAQFYLGVSYAQGQGVPQDYAEAVKWCRKAAEQGHALAQNKLGYCYKNGQGVPQDYAEAVKWYRKAAEQGLADAQCNLAFCYDEGQGVPQNYTEAVKWYRKAAEQGNSDAIALLKRLNAK